MSTYVIGDVHGCYDELQMLIKKIKFNKNKDSLIFLGDLVNRGRDSLKVLNFFVSIIEIVLPLYLEIMTYIYCV